MYNKHFGLEELPFSIAPDPRYLYMSEQHREALAHLVYGFNSNGGFVLLTGEVGTGKTTVCRCLLEQIDDNAAIAFILNPKLTVEELLATICDEFAIQYPEGTESIKLFVDLINKFLLDAHTSGRKAVLIIDEAQNLSADVLEQLRLLTNLETNQHKLLQIILLGQPELRDKLSSQELRQLSQRIIARYHLGPLSKKDVGAYIAHRLSVAGSQKQLFTDSTIDRLYRLSGGVPRLINVLCDRALLGTFTQGKETVNGSTMKKAAQEVLGKNGGQKRHIKTYAWVLSILLFVVVSVVLAKTYYQSEDLQQVETVVPEKAVRSISPELGVPVVINNPGWPEKEPIGKSMGTAYQALFEQWNVTYNPYSNISACQYAVTQGLQCEHKKGNLRSLLLANRPAILKLYNDQGMFFFIVVTNMNEETAQIVIGDESREVSVDDIQSKWLGDYTFLWQTPPGYQGETKPVKQGPLVKWLDEKLAAIQGNTGINGDDPQISGPLFDRLKQFQVTEGLVPDGIVGTLTLVRINTILSANVPKIAAKSEGR